MLQTAILSAIFLLVVLGELILLVRGLYELSRGPAQGVHELVDRQKQDIQDRAKVGLTPEWHQYEQGLAERLADREDSLRVYSAMALTIGVFGTMATMAVVLFLAPEGNLFEQVLRHVGLALIASAWGVVAHILLAFFSRLAHAGASKARKQFLSELRETSRANAATGAVEVQLGAVTTAMQQALIEAVQRSLETLPAVVESLDDRVLALGKLLKATGDSVQEMATAVGSATQRIENAANQLGALSQHMVDVGNAMAGVPGRMEEEVDRLGTTVGTVNEALAALPHTFDQEMRKTIGAWQEESRSQSNAIANGYKDAAAIVSQSVSTLKMEVDRLKDSWQATAGNELRRVMEDVGAGLGQTINDGVREPLTRLGNEFAAAHTHAEQIRSALTDTSASFTGWQTAMSGLLRDADALAERVRKGTEQERTVTVLSELAQAIRALDSRLSSLPGPDASAGREATQLRQLNQQLELLVQHTRPWPSRVMGLMGWYRSPDGSR